MASEHTHYRIFPDKQTEGELADVVILYFDDYDSALHEAEKWGRAKAGYLFVEPRPSTNFPGQWFLRFNP